MKKKVYHYTTKENLANILASKQFIASTPWGPSDDSVFGPGWYFTHKEPHSSDEDIANLWLKSKLDPGDAEAYLVYEVHIDYLKQPSPEKRSDVYKVEYDIITTEYLDINLHYKNGEDIVIQYVGHGFREKKKEVPLKKKEHENLKSYKTPPIIGDTAKSA